LDRRRVFIIRRRRWATAYPEAKTDANTLLEKRISAYDDV